MKRYRSPVLVVVLFLGWAIAAFGERDRLYTETDPANPGGLRGRIVKPGKRILQILAMPPDEPRFVYKGTVSGVNDQSFFFLSLPMANYNLFVIYDDEFYEGLELHKEKNTLTKTDLKKIEYIVTESDPFFTKKVIHRVEGTTGRGNLSRLICTMTRGVSGNVRRTFKLIWLKDVGPGWQVVQKRDLYPLYTNYALPKHHYTETLSRIRVTGSVRDLGELDLTKPRVASSKDKEPDKKGPTENIKDVRDLNLTE